MLRHLTLLSVLLAPLAAQDAAPAKPKKKPDGRNLFLMVCATCHGAEGKGDGPLKVVPRPRDLTSGKFSFGNTRKAILHTVENGIPPAMPPHKDLLNEAQRLAVVEYVMTLMPEQIEMDKKLSTLVVGERPVFVRGALDGHPRGLVLGLPGGLTLAWDCENLRLLGIREGAFVDRTDWRERGGTPLELLGTAWPACGDVAFPAGARVDLRATEVEGQVARLEYDVRFSEGATPVRVVETVRGVIAPEGKLVVRTLTTSAPLALLASEPKAPVAKGEVWRASTKRDATTWVLTTVLAPEWNTAVDARVRAEVAR